MQPLIITRVIVFPVIMNVEASADVISIIIIITSYIKVISTICNFIIYSFTT